MGSDFYSYDQESRCKTSCTTIYKLGAKWRFEKNGRWMKLRKTKMVSTLELVSQHFLMMTIWSKKFFKFWHTRMYHSSGWIRSKLHKNYTKLWLKKKLKTTFRASISNRWCNLQRKIPLCLTVTLKKWPQRRF